MTPARSPGAARHSTLYALSLLMICLPLPAFAQHVHEHGAVGQVNFPISCNDAARQHFDLGLALLHHMMYEQAEEQFSSVAAADEACAMAHWGVAMTQLHPLWDPPTEAAFRRGLDAVERGRSLAARDGRERAHLDAIGAYFDPDPSLNHRARLAAWAAAMANLHASYPDDIDAGAFHALAQLATASPEDRTFANQAQAGALLENLLERAPEHPGLFHYAIHAYDNPVLAQRGVDVARAYDQLAPDVPHALHMPSHIFVRLGMWPDVASWNIRSAEAALRQPVGDATSMHHVHALDYLIYARLQQGKDAQALAVLEEIDAIDHYQDSFAAAYGIAAAQARYPLERGDWSAAAQLPLRTHADFPWDRFGWAEAITWFARGLGAARSGALDGARRAIGELDSLHAQTVAAGETYWSVHVDAQRTTVAAWLAYAEQRFDEALVLMRRAADTEDSVDKHPVTPGAVLPARELLGEMLLLRGDPEGALEAYEASLAISPGRANALLGAGRAAEQDGERERAAAHYQRALEVLAERDGDRPGIAAAKAFLDTQGGA
jgi:tetratricopeptide (TPR) repeat protein